MSASMVLKAALTHPSEARAMITYKVWRDPVHDIRQNPEASGWDREQMRECWAFLDATSRSFAAVIKELKGELSRVICIFYLVLRGLDTIEDDMTLKPEVKVPLLCDFFKKLNEPGWNFTESGPKEKDRQLLVEFDKVIGEYQLLNDGCRRIIADICARMGAGMASYIELSSSSSGLSMQTWSDYELYCHFVAGLVGEGLSGLFSETGIERPAIGQQLSLSNHMGLFLQKTNIIRDYAEDSAEGRFFWPKQCWNWNNVYKSQADVHRGTVEKRPGSGEYVFADSLEGRASQAILSTMLLDAFSHATHSLEYLILLRDQSVFNFCAIPQVMAIATLELMVNNANVFKKNVKIRKSLAVKMILSAVNPRDVALTFRDHARSMHRKITPDDPNYIRWCMELGRIETWIEAKFPTYVSALSSKKDVDLRATAFEQWVRQREDVINKERRRLAGVPVKDVSSSGSLKERRAEDTKFFFAIFLMIIAATVFMSSLALIGWFACWYLLEEGQDPLTLFLGKLFLLVRQQGYRAFMANSIDDFLNKVWSVVRDAGELTQNTMRST